MFSHDSFRAARWVRTINLLLQAVLFLTLCGGLNYLARNHAWRFDLTRQRTFSLSPETLSYIKALERPVRIVVSLAADGDNPEVKGLLNEYAHHTEEMAGKITVEYVDIYQNRRHAEELGLEQADVVLFMSGDKRRVHRVDELYVIKKDERTAFQGEKVVTAAVLEVASQTRKKIYFVTGHGELELSDADPARGLSKIRDQLRLKNFDVDRLDLAVTRGGIPADAALLIIAQPSLQSSFTGREQEMLRQYLATRAGRIILFLPPGKSVDAYGIADLLFDWGILVDDDYVWDPNPASMTEDLDLMVRAYDATHPVVEAVRMAEMPLRFGGVRTVRPDPGKSPASGLTVIPLAGTSKTAWGETAYRNTKTAPTLDAADIRPIPGIAPRDQLGIIVASERVAVRDNVPFSVPGGRMIVFGTGDMISNRRIEANGNFTLFLSAVNWCVDRDRQVNIPPRPLERFSLALSAAEFSRLRYTLLLVLPGTTLILGLLVYWTRRV